MCEHVVILAERNSQQYLSQCEHGTVHLLWDGVGLHLSAEAFNRLAAHILQTRAKILDRGEAASQVHCRLSVGKLSITLPVQEFLLLVEMVDGVMPDLNLTSHGQDNSLFRLVPHKPIPPVLN